MQGALDQEFSLGSGYQHRRAHAQLQRPEFAVPDEVRQWLAGNPAPEQLAVLQGLRCTAGCFGVREEAAARDAQDMRQQYLGIQPGIEVGVGYLPAGGRLQLLHALRQERAAG